MGPTEPHDQETVWLSLRPITSAAAVGDAVRRGARALRIVALLVAALALIGNYLEYFTIGSRLSLSEIKLGTSIDRAGFADLLITLSFPSALAGMIYGFSFVLTHAAARLDLDIVRATTNDQA